MNSCKTTTTNIKKQQASNKKGCAEMWSSKRILPALPQAYSTADPRLAYTSPICSQGHETACEPFDFKTIVSYPDKSIIH